MKRSRYSRNERGAHRLEDNHQIASSGSLGKINGEGDVSSGLFEGVVGYRSEDDLLVSKTYLAFSLQYLKKRTEAQIIKSLLTVWKRLGKFKISQKGRSPARVVQAIINDVMTSCEAKLTVYGRFPSHKGLL